MARKAVRVTELNEQNLVVYGINRERFTTEGFLALPDTATGELSVHPSS